MVERERERNLGYVGSARSERNQLEGGRMERGLLERKILVCSEGGETSGLFVVLFSQSIKSWFVVAEEERRMRDRVSQFDSVRVKGSHVNL